MILPTANGFAGQEGRDLQYPGARENRKGAQLRHLLHRYMPSGAWEGGRRRYGVLPPSSGGEVEWPGEFASGHWMPCAI